MPNPFTLEMFCVYVWKRLRSLLDICVIALKSELTESFQEFCSILIMPVNNLNFELT